MTGQAYQPDARFVPDSVLRDLARQAGTPFYIYDAAGIEAAVTWVQSLFSWNSGFENYVPIRENPNPAILQLLCRSGAGVRAADGMELQLARECGFSGEKLLYAPVRRDPEADAAARALGASWLVHALDLLPTDPVPVLYLRYLPDGSRMDPIQRRRLDRVKYGFSQSQLQTALHRAARWTDTAVGLAMHAASYSLRPGMLAQRWIQLRALADQLRETTGVIVQRFYLGEGPGLAYRPNVQSVTLEQEAEALHAAVDSDAVIAAGICKQVLEPQGLLVTSVLERRTIYRNYLVVDAGISQYLRPALHQAYRHISLVGKNGLENRRLWRVVGVDDDEADRFSDGRMLQDPQPGDLCVLHDVGCGGRCFPMLCASQPVAPEFLYETDGAVRPISPRRSPDDVRQFLYGSL